MGKSKILFQLTSVLTAIFFACAREAPSYSMEFLPETGFSCRGKTNGGYYADVEAECQLYHVCSRNKDGILEDTKFLCGNGTVFDQRRLVCQDYRRVRCSDSPRYYRNVATLLEELEARRRTEEEDRQLLEAPNYSSEFLPRTSFSCRGKRNGGYYADVEAQCQLYHVCSRNKDGILEDIKFLCGNETVFDQRKLVCEDYWRVPCYDSPRFYKNSTTYVENSEGQRTADEHYLLEAPNYSMEHLPKTSFSCKGKRNGGYYADVEANCQMYHVCSRNKYGFLQDTRFLCGNETAFDQRRLVCEDYWKVRCQDAPRFYRDVATRLEALEASRRTEEDNRKLLANANLDLGRLPYY